MKNIKTRLLSFFLTLVMIVGVISAVPVGAEQGAPPKRTVMLYITGSDLESLGGLATGNLIQAMNSDYNENLDFIVITGGTDEWHLKSRYLDGAVEIDADINQIWELTGVRDGEDHGKMKLVEPDGLPGYETAYLSEPETLTAFIDYCTDNYPADLYDLILWDHGGGFAYGYGYDDREKYPEMMSMGTIMGALESSKLISSGKKFEIIDFDACLMSGVEIAAVLAPYTDYLVVSPELEPGPGQDYTPWLDDLCEDPGMSGFELGKRICDALEKYYDYYGVDATLAVIDTKNFTERLLGELKALDDLMIFEAKTAGQKNGRYNFYDELYSLAASFKYSYGEDSLFDLGNLAGALSAPKSEMDNLSPAQIEGQTNGYTDIALRILSILSDDDASGDDVIYSVSTEAAFCKVNEYIVRGLDGEFLETDEDGLIRLEPTGFNIFSGDGDITNVRYYVKGVNNALPHVRDETVRKFLVDRACCAIYYALIIKLGTLVSQLSENGEGSLTPEMVWDYIEENCSSKVRANISFLIDFLVNAGEFGSQEDAKDFFSLVIEQQAKEALNKDKVSVKRIVEADGSSALYQMTVNGTSAQSLMYVNATAKIRLRNFDTPEFREIYQEMYGSLPYSFSFPNGINLNAPVSEGELDINYYFDSFDDEISDVYQRIYSSDTSVWTVPEMKPECFMLYDSESAPHPAYVSYTDRSKTEAIVPIRLFYDDDSQTAYLLISLGDEGWTVDGLSTSNDGAAGRSFIAMDSESFEGVSYTTQISLTDRYGDTDYYPVGTPCPIDITKDKWGITITVEKAGETEEIEDFQPYYYVTDVYGHKYDVTECFTAAETGDAAYAIDCVTAEVGEAICNGNEAHPEVTVSLDGKALEEGVDYKVMYDGSVGPGEAGVFILGIGDLVGTLYVPYTIKCAEHAFVLVNETPATCTAGGTSEYECSVCGEKKVENVDAPGHALTHVEAKAPTKEEDGNIEYWVCENCKAVFTDENGEHEIDADDVTVKLYGDVNGDGKTNAKDVVMIMKYLVGFEQNDFDVSQADFDGNKTINAKDVVAYMRFLIA